MQNKDFSARKPYIQILALPNFPGGAVDKNPPADAGDTVLIPSLGKFHRLQGN